MPMIDATDLWQSVLLTADEAWQNRSDALPVLVTAETPANAADLRGLRLNGGDVWLFRAGQTVSWRVATLRSAPARAPAQIHREAL